VNLRKPVVPQAGKSVADVLQRDVDAIRAGGGFPIINHPNFVLGHHGQGPHAGLRGSGLRAVERPCPDAQPGRSGTPGTEAIWDEVLTSGTLLYGVAADDSHMFKNPGVPTAISIPGRPGSWSAPRSSPRRRFVGAMERGDFYASTGVELASYEVTPQTITIAVKPSSRSKYDVRFVGRAAAC
jgi:hypothetical protein